jgi:hypothetical protein
MANQTLILTLLPNGLTSRGTLALSVHLTPRLDGGATLATFPDVLQWPARLKAGGLTFEVACGATTTTASVDTSVLQPDIWSAIFKPDTFVEAFKIPDFEKRLVVSYPVADALTYLKYAYGSAGCGLQTEQTERGILWSLLHSLMFRDGQKTTLSDALAQAREQLWQEQRRALEAGEPAPVPSTTTPGVTAANASTYLYEPAGTATTATRVALFHHMPDPGPTPLPHTPSDFAKTLDFHRALTAINSYPWLLRALGLVLDLEVPADLCPNSPAAGAYATVQITRITPGFTWKKAPRWVLPKTNYVRAAKSFAIAPATSPDDVAKGAYLAGDIVAGVLALTPASFLLTQVDIDGAFLKALALADNVANASAPLADQSLPALRSAGVGLVATGRGIQLLRSMTQSRVFDDALRANAALPRPFNARDLVRGFRLDIWSSRDGKWRSLHRRNSHYTFGGPSLAFAVTDEEGFLQPTAAQPVGEPTSASGTTAASPPPPGKDLFVHERVATWSGWSLSASRPVTPLNRSPDPQLATTPDPTMNAPMTTFQMTTAFVPFPGSLPSLRFGTEYRVRARAVDLAGNSIPLDTSTPTAFAIPSGDALLYSRFEPVAPPLLVLQQATQLGAGLERMVIRSYNSKESLDALPTTETDHRHVAPPRTSQLMAEQHGVLDDKQHRLRGDSSTYDMLVARDDFEFPTSGGVPLESSNELTVGYLPDPIARGAALRNLPNAPTNTDGRITAGALEYATLPDVQPRDGSVTFIDCGAQWPERLAFLLTLTEGTDAPQWDDTHRELTVSLPKAATVDVELSSYLNPSDLAIMGVWHWFQEHFQAWEYAAMNGGAAEVLVTLRSDTIALLTRLILEGGHPMITPSRTVTLVHAVQQPLSRPAFLQLPVVHGLTTPIFASGLRNSFTPITAWRSHDAHTAVLLGGLSIHGASTSRIDLAAQWLEYNDDPSQPAPTRTQQSDHVETIPLKTLAGGVIYADATATRAVADYIPKTDTLWFGVPFDQLDGLTPPQLAATAAPVHRFNDTKHRFVGYTATATSRFQEYFPPGLDFTRTSETLLVDVPSSGRPAAPDIAYVVPTFGWERQRSSNVKSSVRFGNGLRVYLRRPWYSSGDNELLGVVLWNGAAPDYPTRETFKLFFTQWGNDPLWKTGYLAEVPATGDFPDALATATQLTLDETPHVFDVAAHAVQFDAERGLWYCDIRITNSQAYMPFIRLALARYQPHSIAGVELSRIVLADYAQVTPDRSAVLAIDPADSRRARLFVGGLAPQATPSRSVIEVSVQRRLSHAKSDVAWEVAPATDVTVSENAPDASEPDAVLWSGQITFAKAPPAGQYRVVIREFERLQVDSDPGTILLGERLVFVTVIDYDFP